MNAEQFEKSAFVNGNLSATVREMGVGVQRLRYRMDGAEEFVDVLFTNNYVKRVCVTGDSPKAIALDVLRRV